VTVDVSFVTSGHDVADGRLHRLVAAALREGLTAEVLGLGSPDDAPHGVPVVCRPRGSFADRAATAARYARLARGRVLVALDPDSLVAALAVARARGRAVVADVHEDYVALLDDRAWATGLRGRLGHAVARGAQWAAARADAVFVADEHVPPTGIPGRTVVRNLPDLAMLPEPAERSEQPRALYVGDVRITRGALAMIEAIDVAPGWTLDIVGPIAASEEPEIRARISAAGLTQRVRLHGRLTPERSWELASGAWCGLALLHDTPAFRAALPTKVYEYAGSGLALIVTDLPRQAGFVEQTGTGVTVPVADAADGCAEVLRAWSRDPSPLEGHRAAARAWRERSALGNDYVSAAGVLRRLSECAPRRGSV
jgi:glycosyltransferase involved in cell wall biosynthesis